MTLTSLVALLQSALMLLALAQGPNVPQSLRDTAKSVAQKAIAATTIELASRTASTPKTTVTTPAPQSGASASSPAAGQSSSSSASTPSPVTPVTPTVSATSSTSSTTTASAPTSTCTPQPAQTQTVTCPVGQTGSITQMRTSHCNADATTPTWDAWQTTASTCTVASAPTTPNLSINSVGDVTTVSVSFSGTMPAPTPITEVPIWIIGGGWRAYLFPTSYTYLCATPDSLLSGSVSVQSQYCGRITTEQLHDQTKPWIYNYNGVNTAYVKDELGSNPVLFGAVHGEDKNEVVNGTRVQNTVDTTFSVNPNFDATKCASGYTGTVYNDCWDAYNAFISLATVPYNTASTWGRTSWTNLGPMVWPAAGYTKPDGSKAAHGVRVPTFFPSDDGYLYMYYLDDSIAGGGLFGIKVARARISDLSTKGQYAFYSYVNGSFSQPALPAGFSNDSIASFYSVPGPQTVSLFDSSVTTPIRFAVAAISGTTDYLGVLQYMDSNQVLRVSLTVSNDLVHWSNPTTVAQSQNWGSGKLDFPLFVDSTGWTNTRIDPNDFYIEGTDTAGNEHLMHLSVHVQ